VRSRATEGEERALRVLRTTKRTWLAATIGVVLVGTAAAVAVASPGFGVTSTIFVTANLEQEVHLNSDKVKFQTKGPTDVRVQRLDFAAGAYSGWHHHPGMVIVAVESGALTLTHADCSSVTYGPGLPAGSVFVESGDEPAQATSATGATVYVTYVAPDGAGFRLEDDPVTCP
jgi:quercetin dioxygenase-like cupin family protein